MIEAALVAPAVAPLLWHGSLPPLGAELAASGFEVLCLCNAEPYLPRPLFPGVDVVYCPLRDEGALSKRDRQVACATAESLAALHGDRARKRAANLRYALARAEDAASVVDHAPPPGRAHAQARAELDALRRALAKAEADPAARMPPAWSPGDRPLTARLRDADRTAIVGRRRPPVTLDEHLVLAWMALRAAEKRRVLVACLQGAGLACALTLHLLTGRPGAYCAELVRRARPGALTNASMLELLAALPARPADRRGVA
jgi:hypothetical protein